MKSFNLQIIVNEERILRWKLDSNRMEFDYLLKKAKGNTMFEQFYIFFALKALDGLGKPQGLVQ